MVVTKGHYTLTNLHTKAASLFKYSRHFVKPYIKSLKLVFLATSQNSWEQPLSNSIVKL